ncbi:hypothetical protein AQS8620_01421 [Aquimixticola soesokkakensis]|uniref:Uncharacterized protein n=1 Tax=Aquimixticola soesokkakensis TaxID=1519096 RepID=A0A1Y5SDF8_9RHOB|nr:hypothetical protein [Aquimixticola soesokkakensis]SLN38089.1 hypothetical protein AQS8620_01421 [Aquimixticola soesokkakensis]
MKSTKPTSGGRYTRSPKNGVIVKVSAEVAVAMAGGKETTKAAADQSSTEPDTTKEA